MINITYGIFAEDSANDIFIENIIPQIVAHFGLIDKIKLIHEKEYTEVMIAKSGYYLREHFTLHVNSGIKRFGLQLCFVGLDADDDEHDVIFNEMQEKILDEKLEENTLIFIPVQAIEYWLWYIKVKKENSELTETPKIEHKGRKELKKMVYNRIKPTNKKSNPIVRDLSKDIDFDWLKKNSNSFNHFYNHLKEYLLKTVEKENN